MEYIRQGDEYQRWATVGAYPYGECSREDDQSCQQGNYKVYHTNLHSRTCQIRLFREVAGIGTDTPHRYAH